MLIDAGNLRFSRQIRDEYDTDVFVTRSRPLRDVLPFVKDLKLGSWGSEV